MVDILCRCCCCPYERNTGVGEESEEIELDDWLLEFADLFRQQLGIDMDGHVSIHNEGLEKCTEALELVAHGAAAQPLFDMAASKFQVLSRRSSNMDIYYYYHFPPFTRK